jgi:23S rRNA G2445 N2-methylase RlmL
MVSLATRRKGYASVLMQGSGTFCVEAAIGTAAPPREERRQGAVSASVSKTRARAQLPLKRWMNS